jgi:two-component system LytT family response regulator
MEVLNTIIIDDEKRSIEMLEFLLSFYCPKVKVINTFSDPAKGLNKIVESPPDLLFVDIQMPAMTGFELVKDLIDKATSVIFITAYNGYLIDIMKQKRIAHLLKPIDHEALVIMVNQVLQNEIPALNNSLLEELESITPYGRS